MNKTTTSRYTYAQFAADVIAVMNGEIEITADLREKMTAKAADLANAQAKKAEYNANHPKKAAAKGASAETKAKADAIKGVLGSDPMTAAEINKALGADYTALQVANAVKFIEGIQSCKVVRDTVNGKGLRQQKEYTAYFVG